jgi:hypothetical protein
MNIFEIYLGFTGTRPMDAWAILYDNCLEIRIAEDNPWYPGIGQPEYYIDDYTIWTK